MNHAQAEKIRSFLVVVSKKNQPQHHCQLPGCSQIIFSRALQLGGFNFQAF